MTDRELLELAAEAAGYEVEETAVGGVAKRFRRGELRPWNPLDDNGDAFGLAVRLRMRVSTGQAEIWRDVATGLVGPIIEFSEGDDDPEAATRRAITKAAAELARIARARRSA